MASKSVILQFLTHAFQLFERVAFYFKVFIVQMSHCCIFWRKKRLLLKSSKITFISHFLH